MVKHRYPPNDCQSCGQEHRQSGGPRQKYQALPYCKFFLNFSTFFAFWLWKKKNTCKLSSKFDSLPWYSMINNVGYCREMSKIKKGHEQPCGFSYPPFWMYSLLAFLKSWIALPRENRCSAWRTERKRYHELWELISSLCKRTFCLFIFAKITVWTQTIIPLTLRNYLYLFAKLWRISDVFSPYFYTKL